MSRSIRASGTPGYAPIYPPLAPSLRTVDQAYRHQGHDHVEQADRDVGVGRRLVPETGLREGGGGVVDDGVDADDLLEDGEADGYYEGRPDPRGGQLAQAALLVALYLFDLLDLTPDRLLVAGLAQHVARLVVPASAHQLPRGLRHEVHADEEHERRDNGEPQHRAPGFGGGEQRVDDVSDEDANNYHELVE